VYDTLEQVKGRIDSELFLYETPTGAWKESSVYRFTGLKGGLEVMHEEGVANSYIYLGDGSDIGHIIGLVNVAAFIAQSMVSGMQTKGNTLALYFFEKSSAHF